MPKPKDTEGADVAPEDNAVETLPPVIGSIEETEARRVAASRVDVELPAGHPGPMPAASRPADPNAKMSTLA